MDSALPIETSQHWQRQSSNNGSGRRAASVKVERIGEEIVNSISIHRIQDEEAHLDDIVAVLTNNDKTVRVYSLPGNLETSVLDLPYPMNHATVSPDGQTLVAVGDVALAYFFQREIQDTPPQIHKPHNRLTSASVEWTLTSVVSLHQSEVANTACYFTTAWSPSGQLVAVGSEGGYITVFDIDLLYNPDLKDDDAIVAVVPGSRPDFTNPHPGAIRSMLFSPEPWDLLIWAEDQGRICIGDLRTGLKTRQIVSLDPKDDTLRRIAYVDVPSDSNGATSHLSSSLTMQTPRDIDELEADFIRRYRQVPDNAAAVNFATEYIEARRRQRQQRTDMASLRAQWGGRGNERERERAEGLEDDPRGLTAREQQILDTLRMTRQREEARAAAGGARVVNYTSGEMFGRATGSSTATRGTNDTGGESASTATGRPISEILSAVPDSFPELSRTNANANTLSPRPSSSHGPESQRHRDSNTLPPLSIFQPIAEGYRDLGTIRLSDGSRLPRRRASVIMTPPATNSSSGSSTAASGSSSTAVIRDNGDSSGSISTPATSNRPSSTATAAAAAAEEEENPWRTIEEHMRLERGPLFDAAARSNARSALAEVTASERERDRDRRQPTESELQAELAAERARARSLARQRERWRRLPTTTGTNATSTSAAADNNSPAGAASAGYNDMLLQRARIQMQMRGGHSGREIGVRTAGLAMSPDGRMLWAACEEGIFEVEIGVKGRLFWGAWEPR